MWAVNFDKCIACGKDELPHVSKGLCKRCWDIYQDIDKNKSTHIWRKKGAVPIKYNSIKFQESKLSPRNETKLIVKKWANNFDECVSCRKNDIPHASKGLCKRCYEKYLYRKHNPHMYLPRENKTFQLTKEYLVNEYINNTKSIGDIAKEYKCTRQFIQKKLVQFGIKSRSKSDSRLLAFKKNKFSYSRIDKDGNAKEIIPIKSEVDDFYFSYWSAPMAWVLGFIYADGNLNPGTNEKTKQVRGVRVTMGQKEPEILEKIKVLMHSNQKIVYSKARHYENTTAGALYHLAILSKQIYSDLIKIGLTPNKSLTIAFPDVPKEYLWHFIRGCWDGDGSLYIEKKTQSIHADYVSGSKIFIEKLVEILQKELLIKKISIHHKENSCYIKLHSNNCLKLCHKFYDGISSDLYLSRKFNVYMNYLEKSMSKEKLRVLERQ